ncbi:MAG: hypothetical protein ACE5HV_01345 [Acidobacteriota bacterium]
MKVPSGTHVLIGLAIGVVVVAVVSGLIVLGPPSEQRARRLDDRRVEALRGITRAVDLYWTRHGRLPASLDELSRESGVNINSHDPGTAQLYDYRVLGDKTYELCAHFQRDLPEPPQRVSKVFWSHGAGRQCFQPKVEEVLRQQDTELEAIRQELREIRRALEERRGTD